MTTTTPGSRDYGRILAALSLCASLAALPAVATADPDATPAKPLPSVAALLAGNESARGGLDAWHHMKTMTQHGRIEHGQIKGPKARRAPQVAARGHSLEQALPFTLQFKRPHKMLSLIHI